MTSVAQAQKAPLRAVATTTVIADLVAQVGGDDVEVTSIVPPGVDPHTYEPTAREAREVARADALFVNGLALEFWLEPFLRSVGGPDVKLVVLSDYLDGEDHPELAPHVGQQHDHDHHVAHEPGHHHEHPHDHHHDHHQGGLHHVGGHNHGHHHGHDHGALNPHLWLNPRYAMTYVEAIRDTLIELDIDRAANFEARAAAYLEELEELDAWIQAEIQRLPEDRRLIVTYHDAFAHYAARYGLEVVGYLVLEPDREPSGRVMRDLVDRMRELDVAAVFAEPQINRALARALADEAGAELAILYSDALNDDVPTYVDMMRYNTTVIVESLMKGQ